MKLPKRMHQDNVLVRMTLHDRNQVSAGGIHIPDAHRESRAGANEAVEAVVVLAGPGRPNILGERRRHHGYVELAHGEGTIPMDPSIRPGARVLVDGKHVGNRWYDDERREHRIVREDDIIAVLEEAEAAE